MLLPACHYNKIQNMAKLVILLFRYPNLIWNRVWEVMLVFLGFVLLFV